jgi:DNA-binding PadR family transcriptional regulator
MLYPILHAMESKRWVEAYWIEVEGSRLEPKGYTARSARSSAGIMKI